MNNTFIGSIQKFRNHPNREAPIDQKSMREMFLKYFKRLAENLAKLFL